MSKEENLEKKEKGMLYDPLEFVSMQEEYRKYVRRFNRTDSYMIRQQMLPDIFAEVGNGVTSIEPPFYASWGGKHIHLGKNVLLGNNITFLDDGDIHIDDGVMVGNNCSLMTCSHPVSPKLRCLSEGKISNYVKPIHIKKDAWIGAGVCVMPGVTIGEHAVVGSGSVVTADIPDRVIAYGNPCRVIRVINEKDDHFAPEKQKTGLAHAATRENTLDVRRERMYYQKFPSSMKDLPDFRQRFLALVRGLDPLSVETVVRALKRVTAIRESKEDRMSLYSEAEQWENEDYERQHEQIIRLDRECYYYKGYMLPENFFEACVFEDRCGARYLESQEKLRGKDVIDAGAFIGDSALILSELTDGKVYAFEPSDDNYQKLIKTVKMNPGRRIVPVRLALGESRGTVQMQKSLISSTDTLVKNEQLPYLEQEDTEMETLDGFVREHDLKVGLIKVDIEGAEQMLLRGATETIRNQRPALLISIYHHADDFFGIKPMLEKLLPSYSFKIRHPAIGSVMTETMLICEAEDDR